MKKQITISLGKPSELPKNNKLYLKLKAKLISRGVSVSSWFIERMKNDTAN